MFYTGIEITRVICYYIKNKQINNGYGDTYEFSRTYNDVRNS